MPEEFHWLLEDTADGVESVVIAVRSGKDDDGELDHGFRLPAAGFRLFDFDTVALDHGIGEDLVGDFGGERLRLIR